MEAEEKQPSGIGLAILKIDRNIYCEILNQLQHKMDDIAQHAYGLFF